MTATSAPSPPSAPTGAAALRPRSVARRQAFVALVGRDLAVLRSTLKEFVPRTIIQPLLLVFVFTYVFPKIGQGVGGGPEGEASFSTLLVAGVVALTILFQAIQAVALPLVNEFGVTREIEDRVLAPAPISWVAAAKIVSGAIQAGLAGLIVFPIAAVVPATPVNLQVNWAVLITLGPLAAVLGASLGLFFGTTFQPRQVPVLFGIIIVPLTFLGCVYYPWKSLEAIRWLQIVVLANPLVYLSEGFRAALTESAHMSLWALYPAVVGFTVLLAGLGMRNFRRRVLS